MHDAKLWTLAYVSVAPRGLAAVELERILASSRQHNPEHGVTGVLLHCDGTFMQVLEGPQDGVQAIFLRIRTDPRHTQVRVLFDEAADGREFGGWAMLCEPVDPLEAQTLLGAPAGVRRQSLANYWRAWNRH
jgi:hypothetical protein